MYPFRETSPGQSHPRTFFHLWKYRFLIFHALHRLEKRLHMCHHSSFWHLDLLSYRKQSRHRIRLRLSIQVCLYHVFGLSTKSHRTVCTRDSPFSRFEYLCQIFRHWDTHLCRKSHLFHLTLLHRSFCHQRKLQHIVIHLRKFPSLCLVFSPRATHRHICIRFI